MAGVLENFQKFLRKKSVQKFWKSTKWLFGALIAVPSIAAAIEAACFGLTWNQTVLTPFLKPFVKCKNIKQDGTDGGYPIYQTTVTVKRPIYLKILWNDLSMGYQLNFEADKGFTFNEIGDLTKSDGLLFLERRFSSEAHIAKSIHFSHRFLKEKSFQFDATVSGPTLLMEDECPFVYSVHY